MNLIPYKASRLHQQLSHRNGLPVAQLAGTRNNPAPGGRQLLAHSQDERAFRRGARGTRHGDSSTACQRLPSTPAQNESAKSDGPRRGLLRLRHQVARASRFITCAPPVQKPLTHRRENASSNLLLDFFPTFPLWAQAAIYQTKSGSSDCPQIAKRPPPKGVGAAELSRGSEAFLAVLSTMWVTCDVEH